MGLRPRRHAKPTARHSSAISSPENGCAHFRIRVTVAPASTSKAGTLPVKRGANQ